MVILAVIKCDCDCFQGETRNSTHDFSSKKWRGRGRLNVYLESRLKLDLFSKNYMYSERGNFAPSFYNKNSLLMFFRNSRFLEGVLTQNVYHPMWYNLRNTYLINYGDVI